MNGIPLDTFQLELHTVNPDSQNPAQTILDWRQKMEYVMAEITDTDDTFNFHTEYHRLPLYMFTGFSFDELCKLYHSSFFMMSSSVDDLFERDAQYEIVRKIKNSIWRWSSCSSMWNEIVDGYNNIRNFVFIENQDFDIRFDYTVGCNQRGYSKYSRIFLDGVFGLLVYHKGVHVLTIGFSIGSNRQLYLQQVQLARRSGNRWLYKLPKKRLEFVIDRLRECFVGYTIHVIDGNKLVDISLDAYRYALQQRKDRLSYRNSLSVNQLSSLESERDILQEKIDHLEKDRPRLVNFYRDVGCSYQIGKNPVIALGVPHYPIAALV